LTHGFKSHYLRSSCCAHRASRDEIYHRTRPSVVCLPGTTAEALLNQVLVGRRANGLLALKAPTFHLGYKRELVKYVLLAVQDESTVDNKSSDMVLIT